MTPPQIPPPEAAALPPGQRLAAYRRLTLTVPAQGDIDGLTGRIVTRLPEYCPWIATVAIRLFTSEGDLRRVTPDPEGVFRERVSLGEPPAGWAVERGDAFILLDTATAPELGRPAGSTAAAPITRLDGAVAGALEVVAPAPFGLLDSDGQGLRQLGQAIARLVPPESPVYRPPRRDRTRVRALLAGWERDPSVRAPSTAVEAFGALDPAHQADVLKTETAAVIAITRGLAGLPMGAPNTAEMTAAPTPAAGTPSDAGRVEVYRLIHRELRRALSQLTDADLGRDAGLEAWIAALGKNSGRGAPPDAG